MTVDEFLALVSLQPEVRQERTVRVFGPTLRAEIESGQTTILSDVFNHPDQTFERRVFRYRHLTGHGVDESTLVAWECRHEASLPADLRLLLLRVDGIHLWANLDWGRSYFGVSPLSEWQHASSEQWRSFFGVSAPRSWIISYHDNGDDFLVLDIEHSEYRWHDLEDFDRPRVVARSVEELLEWYWAMADTMNPSA